MKKYGVLHTLKKLYSGQTIARILLNKELTKETISGIIVDIGGGHRPDYFDYMHASPGSSIEVVDLSVNGIDFEKDRLPYNDGSVSTVLLFNVLEHIYNYRHILSETKRILRHEGSLLGFVPFLVGYHPDPHDYFRYTREALARIFSDAGFQNIRIVEVGGGPFSVNFNTIVLSLPRILRPIVYVWYCALDTIFLSLRPAAKKRLPLGFIFRCSK